MQLNVTTDYAIRTVLYLGQCKKIASATEISNEMGIPRGYLEKVLSKLKKAEYMETRLGQNYEGIISGVTGWGLYVELPNTVEGLVHISTLMDDYYHFDEETYCLVGEKTGHTYRLGQKVTVKVSQVDLSTKSIDFILKEENSCFNKYMDWED